MATTKMLGIVSRVILVGTAFIAVLGLSSHLIASTLSDRMGATSLSMLGSNDRSVFAPAAYGMDSQTAVDDDEDMLQSIQNLETKKTKSVTTLALPHETSPQPGADSIPPSIFMAFQRARAKLNAGNWQEADDESTAGPSSQQPSSVQGHASKPTVRSNFERFHSSQNTGHSNIQHIRHEQHAAQGSDTTLRSLQHQVQTLEEEVKLKQKISMLRHELRESGSSNQQPNGAQIVQQSDVQPEVNQHQNWQGPGRSDAVVSADEGRSSVLSLAAQRRMERGEADFTVPSGDRAPESPRARRDKARKGLEALHAALLRKLDAEMRGLKAVRASYAQSLDTPTPPGNAPDAPTIKSKLSFAAQRRDLRWVRNTQALDAQPAADGAPPPCAKPECLVLGGGRNTETAAPVGGGISLTRIKGVGADKCDYLSVDGAVGHKLSVALEGSDGYQREWTGYGQVYTGCVDRRGGVTETVLATDQITGDQQSFQWTA